MAFPGSSKSTRLGSRKSNRTRRAWERFTHRKRRLWITRRSQQHSAQRFKRKEARSGPVTPVSGLASMADAITITTPTLEIRANYLVNCAGLQADRIAMMSGAQPEVRIVPFRGEYYLLASRKRCTHPRFDLSCHRPALAVSGGALYPPCSWKCGSRSECSPGVGAQRDTAGVASAFLTLGKHFALGAFGRWRGIGGVPVSLSFYRSLSKAAFVHSLQKLLPDIRSEDLVRGGAGVRAQAVRLRRCAAGRFLFRENSSRALPCSQCTLPCRDCIARHRRVHRRAGGKSNSAEKVMDISGHYTSQHGVIARGADR